jgi:hypothetical protein
MQSLLAADDNAAIQEWHRKRVPLPADKSQGEFRIQSRCQVSVDKRIIGRLRVRTVERIQDINIVKSWHVSRGLEDPRPQLWWEVTSFPLQRHDGQTDSRYDVSNSWSMTHGP